MCKHRRVLYKLEENSRYAEQMLTLRGWRNVNHMQILRGKWISKVNLDCQCAYLSTIPWNVRGSVGTAARILNLGIRWKWVVSFTPRLFHPVERILRYPLDTRLCGPQSRFGRGGEEEQKNHCFRRESNPARPAHKLENFSSRHRVQPCSGAHSDSYPKSTGGSFCGGEAFGAWIWPLTSIKCRGW